MRKNYEYRVKTGRTKEQVIEWIEMMERDGWERNLGNGHWQKKEWPYAYNGLVSPSSNQAIFKMQKRYWAEVRREIKY